MSGLKKTCLYLSISEKITENFTALKSWDSKRFLKYNFSTNFSYCNVASFGSILNEILSINNFNLLISATSQHVKKWIIFNLLSLSVCISVSTSESACLSVCLSLFLSFPLLLLLLHLLPCISLFLSLLFFSPSFSLSLHALTYS